MQCLCLFLLVENVFVRFWFLKKLFLLFSLYAMLKINFKK
jgi:hypothetical protein